MSLSFAKVSIQRTLRSFSNFKLTTNRNVMTSSGDKCATPPSSQLTVQHDPAKKLFYIPLNNGVNAILEYEWVKDGVVNLYHTEVPNSHRGQGIAKELAKCAFDYVIAKDAKMILGCSYLAKYVSENPLPEYTQRVCTD